MIYEHSKKYPLRTHWIYTMPPPTPPPPDCFDMMIWSTLKTVSDASIASLKAEIDAMGITGASGSTQISTMMGKFASVCLELGLVRVGSAVNRHCYRFSSQFNLSSSFQTLITTNRPGKLPGEQSMELPRVKNTTRLFDHTLWLLPFSIIFRQFWAIPINMLNSNRQWSTTIWKSAP